MQANVGRCALDGDISASGVGLQSIAGVRYFERARPGLEACLPPNRVESDVARPGSDPRLTLDLRKLDVATAAKNLDVAVDFRCSHVTRCTSEIGRALDPANIPVSRAGRAAELCVLRNDNCIVYGNVASAPPGTTDPDQVTFLRDWRGWFNLLQTSLPTPRRPWIHVN